MLFFLMLLPALLFGEADVFTQIYETCAWDCNEYGEGSSGYGSRIDQTKEYRAFLQKFLKDYGIRSVVDAGCGDWTFSYAVDWTGIDYKGFDIVASVIEKNKQRYGAPNVHFEAADFSEKELPAADLLICKDVFQHLPNADVAAFLETVSKYKYCLITNDVDPATKTAANSDIPKGGHRWIDIKAEPFLASAVEVLYYKNGPNLKQVLLITPSSSPTVLLAILARNKAHILPRFLDCIDRLDYHKKNISVYINTNNNCDETEKLLRDWAHLHQDEYRSIEFETHHVESLDQTRPHEWTANRFKTLALIRNKSLQKALEHNTDYYFVVDCDNFIIPKTLAHLVAKDKPIIAPLLKSIPEVGDLYSNYFCAISENGYYADHPDYGKIWVGEKVGTFEVPVVHCTYLIRKDALANLSYIDGTEDYEFVIFSRNARACHIPQYICNEHPFGTLLHFRTDVSLEEEKNRCRCL